MKSHVETVHKNVSPAIAEEVEDDPADMEQPESSHDFAQAEQHSQPIQAEGEQHEAHLIQHQEAHMMSQPEHQEQHATYILPDVSLLSGAQQVNRRSLLYKAVGFSDSSVARFRNFVNLNRV